MARGGGGGRQHIPEEELPAETPEQAAARLELGRTIYNNNMRLVTEIMDKKGLFLATMGAAGDIQTVERVKACPAKPGTFRLISRGDGTVPSFGSFEALSSDQRRISGLMITDFLKISSVVDRERTIGVVEGGEKVSNLKDRFGGVPVTSSQLREEREKMAVMLKERDEEKQKRELEEAMEEFNTFMSFEDMLKQERDGDGGEKEFLEDDGSKEEFSNGNNDIISFEEMLEKEKSYATDLEAEKDDINGEGTRDITTEQEKRIERNRKKRERQKRGKKKKRASEAEEVTALSTATILSKTLL